MNFLRRWWWPLFTFLYPLVVWPFGASHAGVVLAKHYFTLLFLLGGLFLELTAHPQVHLAHLRHLPRFLRAHPPLVLALFLALWMGLATALSPEPQVALTGSVVDYSDGLVWGLMMVGVFALGYLRSSCFASPCRKRRGVLWLLLALYLRDGEESPSPPLGSLQC